MSLKKILFTPAFVISGLWIFLTIINIEKPYHSDDSFHLEAAQHILKDPLHPMTGLIRWDHANPEPIYKANQPPLLFYMIACVASVFGFNEIALHLLISFFSFLALFWFYKVTILYGAPKPLLQLLLFGLCPALVVNQNVMTDIPLLAMLLGVVYYLLLAEKKQQFKYNIIGFILLSFGLLIKYTLLPVLASLILLFLLRKQYRNLTLALIPIGILSLWSFWNYQEYGGVHIFERNTTPLIPRWELLWSYFSCLGAIATFSLFSLNYFLKGKLKMQFVYGFTILFILVALIDYFSPNLENKNLNTILEIIFFVNGVIIISAVIKIAYANISRNRRSKFLYSPQSMMIFISGSISLFLILFAPFMATRHILLIIPFLLWLSNPIFVDRPVELSIYSSALAFVFSLILGISDWQYAEIYRNTAKVIAKGAPANSRVWASGTGGWQWYARENSMLTYSIGSSNVQIRDYIVIPKGLPQYRITTEINKTLINKIWQKKESPFSYFSTKNFSMYYSSFGSPPWKLSKAPIDTIFIVQCIAPKAK